MLLLKLRTGFPGGKPHGGMDSAPVKKLRIIPIDTAVAIGNKLINNSLITPALATILHDMNCYMLQHAPSLTGLITTDVTLSLSPETSFLCTSEVGIR